MKNILLTGIIAIAFGLSAFAQTEVVQGKQYTFTANPNTFSEYHWSISGGSNSDLTGITSSTSVTWDNGTLGSTYDLTVYAINGGCAGDDKVKQYILVDKLSYNGSFVKGYDACPITTRNLSSAGSFDMQITIVTGAALAITDNITVSFMVNGVPQPTQTINPDASGLVKVNVPFTGADGTNNTSADIAKNIVVTGIAISGRNPVSIPDDARPTGSFNLKASPVITDIF